MLFTSWLLEQIDIPGDLMDISKVCYSDINNGCASSRFTPQEWVDHFNARHKDRSDILTQMLFIAYLEYMKEHRR